MLHECACYAYSAFDTGRDALTLMLTCVHPCHAMQEVLSSVEAAAQTSRAREEEARAQAREYSERTRLAETLRDEFEHENSELRLQQEIWQKQVSCCWALGTLPRCCPVQLSRDSARHEMFRMIACMSCMHVVGAGVAMAPLLSGCSLLISMDSSGLGWAAAPAAMHVHAASVLSSPHRCCCDAQVKQLEAVVARHKQELDLRQREVDQLTTLSLRGDATVQEYMAGLKVGTGHKARPQHDKALPFAACMLSWVCAQCSTSHHSASFNAQTRIMIHASMCLCSKL